MFGHDSAIRRTLGYRRFVPGRPLRALCLTSGYHLQQECCRALLALGHEAFELNIRVGGPADVARLLLQAMLRVRPDFLLLVNHIGFDDEGGIGSLLEWLRMPLAVWYVDNPFFVIRNLQFPAPSLSSVFLWERSLLPPLRAANVEDIHFLPLATDPFHFAPGAHSLRWPLSFVGNSMEHARKKWSQDLAGDALEIACRWRQELIENRQPMVERTLGLSRAQPKLPAWDILACATFSATGHYRQRLLAAADQAKLHVFGDGCWPNVLPGAHAHPSVPYGEPLARVYRETAVNLNATSLQMPTAVNQRVFDVPAAGGFLLTDAQSDLCEHFVRGEEVVAFDSPAELRSLADFYRRRPDLRLAIIKRAQSRIAKEHTYAHRLERIVTHLVRRHGPTRFVSQRLRQLEAPLPARGGPCS